MQDEVTQEERDASSQGAGGARTKAPPPLTERALYWSLRIWRPAGTVLAVALALMLGWHVVNGKHGLSVWQQKTAYYLQLAISGEFQRRFRQPQCAWERLPVNKSRGPALRYRN